MSCILLIDDEVSVRNMLRMFLSEHGYSVIVAENGRRGQELLAKHDVGLVITDIFMPTQDGFEAILEMRKTRKDIAILAISGGGVLNFQEVPRIARALGADHALAKPVDLDVLLRVVRELLARYEQRRAPQPPTP